MAESTTLRDQARAIWDAGVAAVRPDILLAEAFADNRLPLREALRRAGRILVVGGGKAGGAMAAAFEELLSDSLDRVDGFLNVPEDVVRPLQRIYLHGARPRASNQPTEAGVEGSKHILRLVSSAGPGDVVVCLISGGGSALLPAPVEGVSLADKQKVTRLLHACGATINEMNAVRKHLSRIKGGRLAQGFRGDAWFSLIISDVVGDALDVIASGPTAPDPTMFTDALAVLTKYRLTDDVPAGVRHYLKKGAAGEVPETPKVLPATIHNRVIGNNARALAAAGKKAEEIGYRVLSLGSRIEGDTTVCAQIMSAVAASIAGDHIPLSPPVCLLSGGETTVTLPEGHGLGGRNQEFVFAALDYFASRGLGDIVVLSGGTDGEDGPTDAAGAWADRELLVKARDLCLSPSVYLQRHDAYHFFEKTGGLLKTGLTQTNVMDVRLFLIPTPSR